MEEQPDRMEAQERIAAAFKAKTGHEVKVVPVSEKDIATRATAAFGGWRFARCAEPHSTALTSFCISGHA